MNIPYDEMPEKIEELMAEVERTESENKHLLDLQKNMDKQYTKLENNWNELKEWLKKEHEEFFNRLPDYAIAIENLVDKIQEIESGKND